MAENTEPGDETLENSKINEQQELLNENIFSVESENIIPNQETENMEVHKHPHLVLHKRKWTEYLLEFLMLFLAVFLGFVAENIRENSVERNRERDYMKSFTEDLQSDSIFLFQRLRLTNETINHVDSLMLLLNIANKEQRANDIYFFFSFLGRGSRFNVNDKTVIQLRNAGGMRLITNKSVADSIVAYYS